MNKWQRSGAGIYGAIENALDDLRHTWERFAYGRKITGEVDMFPSPERQEPRLSTAEMFDRLYGRTPERGEDGRESQTQQREEGQEREIDR
jgi:hypothetical protein